RGNKEVATPTGRLRPVTFDRIDPFLGPRLEYARPEAPSSQEKAMSRFTKPSSVGLLAGVLVCLALVSLEFAPAETCLSPYVTRLNRQEKLLYVFCLDAAAKNHDSMITIDVDPD